MRCERCGRFSTACTCDKEETPAFGTDNYPSQGRERTSVDAYHSIDSVRAESRRAVYEVIIANVAAGRSGATQDEVGEATGKPPNSVWPRFKELESDGYIFKGELRRPTRAGRAAIVWEPWPIEPVPVPDEGPLPGQERLFS